MAEFIRQKKSGFTLIEVLVALAILSIALTAVIKATSQNIRNIHYLQNKTIAVWIGKRIINEVRLGIVKLPHSTEGIEKRTDAMGQTWRWKAYITKTPNPHIQEINVDIFQQTNNVHLSHLTGYLYVSK